MFFQSEHDSALDIHRSVGYIFFNTDFLNNNIISEFKQFRKYSTVTETAIFVSLMRALLPDDKNSEVALSLLQLLSFWQRKVSLSNIIV